MSAPWQDYPEMTHLFGAYYWSWAKRGLAGCGGGGRYYNDGKLMANTCYEFRRVIGPLFVLGFHP